MKKYRSSIERHIAPYRGISSKVDYVNFNLAVMHDFLNIYNLSGANPDIVGHKQVSENNLSAMITGEKNFETNSYSAGTIKRVIETRKELSNLNNWNITTTGSSVPGEIIDKEDHSWELIPPSADKGTLRLEHNLKVESGEKILIRFRPLNWNPDTVYQFGATNSDNFGNSNFKKIEVDEFNSYTELSSTFFEHTIRFDEDREVTLVIENTNSNKGVLGDTSILIEEFQIYNIEEEDVYVQGVDSLFKPLISSNQMKLEFIENRLKERK